MQSLRNERIDFEDLEKQKAYLRPIQESRLIDEFDYGSFQELKSIHTRSAINRTERNSSTKHLEESDSNNITFLDMDMKSIYKDMEEKQTPKNRMLNVVNIRKKQRHKSGVFTYEKQENNDLSPSLELKNNSLCSVDRKSEKCKNGFLLKRMESPILAINDAPLFDLREDISLESIKENDLEESRVTEEGQHKPIKSQIESRNAKQVLLQESIKKLDHFIIKIPEAVSGTSIKNTETSHLCRFSEECDTIMQRLNKILEMINLELKSRSFMYRKPAEKLIKLQTPPEIISIGTMCNFEESKASQTDEQIDESKILVEEIAHKNEPKNSVDDLDSRSSSNYRIRMVDRSQLKGILCEVFAKEALKISKNIRARTKKIRPVGYSKPMLRRSSKEGFISFFEPQKIQANTSIYYQRRGESTYRPRSTMREVRQSLRTHRNRIAV